VAVKFPQIRRARVLAIEVQVGRAGTLTPVAKLEPVVLAGSTVSASLHNEEGGQAQDVRVRRSGVERRRIIPQIVES
jgi:DNA ligase (NAD+)